MGRKGVAVSQIATVMVAVAMATVAALMAFTSTVRTRMPDAVPAVWPDPVAALTAWSSVVGTAPDRLGDARTRRLSIAVLRTQPLNPLALRMLAGWHAAHGAPSQANQFADLSQQVSRRDLGTQLFQIEHLVSKGDIAGALSHYDIALRTAPDSRTILFPILINAMRDPAIRKAMVPYVRHNTPWMAGFLFNALDAQGGAVSVARLLLDPRINTQFGLANDLASPLLTHLVNVGEFDLAERYIARLPGANPSPLADTSIDSRTTDPRFGPFRWQPSDAPDIDTTFERLDGSKRLLTVSAHARAIGTQVVAQRILKLPPGSYRFAERRGAMSDGGTTIWRVSCLSPTAAPVIVWSSDQVGSVLTIPASCPWQRINLSVTGAQDSSSYNVMIEDVQFRQVGQSTAKTAQRS